MRQIKTQKYEEIKKKVKYNEHKILTQDKIILTTEYQVFVFDRRSLELETHKRFKQVIPENFTNPLNFINEFELVDQHMISKNSNLRVGTETKWFMNKVSDLLI